MSCSFGRMLAIHFYMPEVNYRVKIIGSGLAVPHFQNTSIRLSVGQFSSLRVAAKCKM